MLILSTYNKLERRSIIRRVLQITGKLLQENGV